MLRFENYFCCLLNCYFIFYSFVLMSELNSLLSSFLKSVVNKKSAPKRERLSLENILFRLFLSFQLFFQCSKSVDIAQCS